jgi:hypothetical protein
MDQGRALRGRLSRFCSVLHVSGLPILSSTRLTLAEMRTGIDNADFSDTSPKVYCSVQQCLCPYVNSTYGGRISRNAREADLSPSR